MILMQKDKIYSK